MPQPAHPPHPDSREALVRSARALFAERGFERTTMRAVAGEAGVDPALIYHYFPGGKRSLLAAALTLPSPVLAATAGVAADPDRAGYEIVRRVIHYWDTDEALRQHGVALLRIAVASDTASAMLRTVVADLVQGLVGDVLADDDRDLRAGLVASQVQGLLLHRYVLRTGLAGADPQSLVSAVGPVLQRYINGSLHGPV